MLIPMFIHLREPFISVPIPGTKTSSSESIAKTMSTLYIFKLENLDVTPFLETNRINL